jgi:hypothetical protein
MIIWMEANKRSIRPALLHHDPHQNEKRDRHQLIVQHGGVGVERHQ